ncbi:MAG: hypothetical protein FIA92_04110 [Chloroflexi bacterium]|nr:hypothetical protein [Chloroflexota bacterium]
MTILARWRPTRWTAGVARLAIVVALLAGCGEAPGTPAASTSAPTASVAGPSPTAQACRPVEAPAVTNGWRERTFYEIFVRSFADADGDGIGDIAGLTAKLDYLNDGDAGTTDDLGVTGIWLMPVAEASSYHGYDVTDYEAVESDYGTTDGLRGFVDAAHQRGIAVIVDFVPNHTSSEHPWFRDALRGGDHREWYVWSDEDPGWPPVAGPNPWHAAPNGSPFYYGAFSDRMPDLNLANPEVTAELERIAAFWLVEVGVDGFRIDAAKHLVEEGPAAQTNTAASHRWLEAFREAIAAIKPEAWWSVRCST